MEEDRFIRVAEVSKMTGMSNATIWRKIKKDDGFPKPIKVSDGITAWRFSEVSEWMRSRPVSSLENRTKALLTSREK